LRRKLNLNGPLLVGTWAAAEWAIRFYARHGFRQVSVPEKEQLLKTYWRVPERQRESSVVLVRQVHDLPMHFSSGMPKAVASKCFRN
jgi:hypothetical protein